MLKTRQVCLLGQLLPIKLYLKSIFLSEGVITHFFSIGNLQSKDTMFECFSNWPLTAVFDLIRPTYIFKKISNVIFICINFGSFVTFLIDNIKNIFFKKTYFIFSHFKFECKQNILLKKKFILAIYEEFGLLYYDFRNRSIMNYFGADLRYFTDDFI